MSIKSTSSFIVSDVIKLSFILLFLILVPTCDGLNEFLILTGILDSIIGSIVEGCKTSAPKFAISDASSYVKSEIDLEFFIILGLHVIIPFTSLKN